MKTIVLISPYWKEPHRWMVSSFKLAELWQTMGYRVVVFCLHSTDGIVEQTDTLTVYGVKDVFLKDPFNFGIAWGFSRRVRAYITEHSPEYIIINKLLFWSSWSIIPLRLRGIRPVVLTDALVGMTWWPRAWYMKIVMGIGGWTMGLLTMKLARKLVFFHPQPKRLLTTIGVAKKTQVIPTGIDTTALPYKEPSADTVTITYVGRLESVKGVDDFCAAVAPLKKVHQNVRVLVVGKSSSDHPLVKQYGDVIEFVGLRNDVAEILQNTNIYVLPSYSEGLSNALMEAMCSGCACIASNVGGNRYLLNNAECGVLFEPGDRNALQQAIEELLANHTKQLELAGSARKRIEQHFDWQMVASQYQELFATLHS